MIQIFADERLAIFVFFTPLIHFFRRDQLPQTLNNGKHNGITLLDVFVLETADHSEDPNEVGDEGAALVDEEEEERRPG